MKPIQVCLIAIMQCLLLACEDEQANPVRSAFATVRTASLAQRPPPCSRLALWARLQGIVDTVHADVAGNTGYVMAVRAERSHFAASFSAGPVAPNATFRIASVTKPFTAAAILRLVESNRLSLDDTVSTLLAEPYLSLLRSDGYDPDAITIRQLLSHTSGLFDYAFPNEEYEDYLEAVRADPSRYWTREDQVRFAVEHGDPVGAPGEVYHYSDTGYVLLGAVLEQQTGQNLGDAVAGLLRFDRLGLRNTWLETVQPRPWFAPARMPQTYEGIPLAEVSATVDLWGGGGLVSSAGDLARFFEALIAGKVYRRPETLETMLTIPPPNEVESAAMGIYRATLASGENCWFHTGLYNVFAMSCPTFGVTVVVAGVDTPQSDAGWLQIAAQSLEQVIACASP